MVGMKEPVRLALIGHGAMAKALASRLRASATPVEAVLVRTAPADERLAECVLTSVEDLVAWRPTLVVECAGHGVVRDAVPVLLASGIPVVLASIGALGDPSTRANLGRAAAHGGGRLILASGAMGGLDALAAGRHAGLDSVTYIGRKPPGTWAGTPAADRFDLAGLTSATTIFEGNAADAARLYPKNANVTAAVALAGLGFEATRVELVADPAITRNVHEVEARGGFGTLRVGLSNAPLPDNPKTSWLAALSLEEAIRRETQLLPFAL